MTAKRAIFGLVLVFLGLLLLGRSFHLYYFSFRDFFSLFLPLLLIAIGFWLIVRKKHQEDRFRQEADFQYYASQEAPSQGTRASYQSKTGAGEATSQTGHVSEAPVFSQQGKTKYSKVLGDMFIDCDGLSLQSVEVSSGLGDVEIKLHNGKLARGLNRMVISGFLGDIRILVPPDMALFAQCSNFIGDVELLGKRTSGFGNNIDGQTASYNGADSKLYVAISNFIGDVRVYVV